MLLFHCITSSWSAVYMSPIYISYKKPQEYARNIKKHLKSMLKIILRLFVACPVGKFHRKLQTSLSSQFNLQKLFSSGLELTSKANGNKILQIYIVSLMRGLHPFIILQCRKICTAKLTLFTKSGRKQTDEFYNKHYILGPGLKDTTTDTTDTTVRQQ